MWAQQIKFRAKPGRESEIRSLFDEINSLEQPGSGLLRSTVMRDTRDHLSFHAFVVFESEEKARARESDPVRQQALSGVMARKGELFEMPPAFVDFDVLAEVVYT